MNQDVLIVGAGLSGLCCARKLQQQGTRVMRVGPGSVTLATGEDLGAKAVVVAADGRMAAELLGDSISPAGQGTTCLYFTASRSPITQPLLVLNGDGRGPINSLCFLTVAAPSYGPTDECLVSATVLGTGNDHDRLLAEVREQLGEWFGTAVIDAGADVIGGLPRRVPRTRLLLIIEMKKKVSQQQQARPRRAAVVC